MPMKEGTLQSWIEDINEIYRRKKEARKPHEIAKKAQTLRGLKAKLYNKERFKEKIQMQKAIKANEEKSIDVKVDKPDEGAVPAYLLDRENVNQTKVWAIWEIKRINKCS